MRHTYRVEIWVYHTIINAYETHSKKDALDWIRRIGYAEMADQGACYVNIYIDGKQLAPCEKYNNGWIY